jgi:cation transport regulator
MAKSKGKRNKRNKSMSSGRETKRKDKKISARTKKQIDSLPEHAQHIYEKAHASAIDQYKNPEKRRSGKRQSAEQVAHKTAWAAVKKQYKKKGNEWVKKGE